MTNFYKYKWQRIILNKRNTKTTHFSNFSSYCATRDYQKMKIINNYIFNDNTKKRNSFRVLHGNEWWPEKLSYENRTNSAAWKRWLTSFDVLLSCQQPTWWIPCYLRNRKRWDAEISMFGRTEYNKRVRGHFWVGTSSTSNICTIVHLYSLITIPVSITAVIGNIDDVKATVISMEKEKEKTIAWFFF